MPRSGVLGLWDRLVGPDATRGEHGLVLAYALSFAVGLLAYVRIQSLGWSLVQQAVVAVFALDIAGGIVANTTDAGARWWHRSSQGPWDHFGFVSAHLHPFVLAVLFETVTWYESALIYGFLIVSAALVLLSPHRFRRPVGMLLVSVGVLVGLMLVSVEPGLEWFAPFLYLKLVGGHLTSG
ncbi:hypothetical protein C499_12065 [Halogeometricum borinquense DSM 11551]|uniref:Uncharacterized protein n=1 Tax=Halogeometricum borinquense (strain ATCC 700274 / DSM 11551 / JCM 10706 / KCTC 4070 / PR3) TaxID=469382 RepID=E4NWR0_HALBP|nr:hypothetical protein [Halogeometricum borinquense]ADQ69480.1 hypothetical protein Hbor_37740 [Halogeometricum borinquense DSM 11551]ELY26192.1 hypothetical protein C499_12065 [Halogeometricum borinquense DSM 11551]